MAGPPGPPPRPGLQWREITHRWVRPVESTGNAGLEAPRVELWEKTLWSKVSAEHSDVAPPHDFKSIAYLVPILHIDRVTEFEFRSKSPRSNVGGRYFWEAGQVSIYPGGRQVSSIIHEIGHAVHLGSISNLSILSGRIRHAVKREYSSALDTGSGFPSEYASKNVEEFFAECYATYAMDPKKLLKRNPKMYQVMQEVFSEQSNDN